MTSYANPISFPLHTPGRTTKASPADVRRNNRSLVFGLLFPNGQLSRADLGRQTGLSRVAISGVANSMLDEGLICESGFDVNASGKGKRGTLLSIDTSRLHIISVDLSQEHLVQGAVTDLLGTPQQRMEMALGPDNDINADMIVQLVDQLRTDIDADTIIGIGIAATGVVEDGVIRESTVLGWRDLDLRGMLERRFGFPVTISNDVVCSMLAERFFGHGDKSMLFIKIDRGIGAATLIDDVTVIGQNHAGGEIGHISLDPESGVLCPCGKRGCLETMVTSPVIRERIRRALPERGSGPRFISQGPFGGSLSDRSRCNDEPRRWRIRAARYPNPPGTVARRYACGTSTTTPCPHGAASPPGMPRSRCPAGRTRICR